MNDPMRSRASFDLGRGRISEGDRVIVTTRRGEYTGRAGIIFQDGEVDIIPDNSEWFGGTFKWRYVRLATEKDMPGCDEKIEQDEQRKDPSPAELDAELSRIAQELHRVAVANRAAGRLLRISVETPAAGSASVTIGTRNFRVEVDAEHVVRV